MEPADAWLDALEERLGDDPEALVLLAQLRNRLDELALGLRQQARGQQLLERTVGLLGQRGLRLAADTILDTMLHTLGASRGVVGLVEGSEWRSVAARALSREDIEDPSAVTSRGIITRVLEGGEAVVLDDAATDGPMAHRASVSALALRSVACFPVRGQGLRGFVYLDNPEAARLFDPVAVDAVKAWLPAFQAVLTRERREEDQGRSPFPEVLTRASALRHQLEELHRVARFDAPVLLSGATGTGKSHLARAVHRASHRARGPFVHLNAAAVPQELVEGELFGAEAGAYTGATRSRPGLFEAAQGGTLFLDELDKMPLACQAKLLVAVQERQVTRLGSTRPVQVDVRLLAAIGSDPQVAVTRGTLREDLYYRLAVLHVRLPALRERPEDVPLLARHALTRARERYGLPAVRLSAGALEALQAHSWPGNVRELENVLDRAALLCEDGLIEAEDLELDQGVRAAPAAGGVRRAAVPREEFLAAWQRHGGKTRPIARELGVAERSVLRLRKKYLDSA